MKRLLAAAFGAALLLALPQLAIGKVWLRIAVEPPSPRVGELARISVLTGYLTELRCASDPAASFIPNATWYTSTEAALRVRLAAIEPVTARPAPIELRQRESDRAYWDGAFAFPAPGTWTLRITEPSWGSSGPEEECAGFRRTVDVRESARDGEEPISLWLVAFAVIAVAGIGTFVAWARSRQT